MYTPDLSPYTVGSMARGIDKKVCRVGLTSITNIDFDKFFN